MSAIFKDIQIKNFKSIQNLNLEFERINIFIGKPNAGKSNILEAISLLGLPFPETHDQNDYLKRLVRLDDMAHLFHEFDINEEIDIFVNQESVSLNIKELKNTNNQFQLSIKNLNNQISIPSQTITFHTNGMYQGAAAQNQNLLNIVKKYEFKGLIESEINGSILKMPNGDNIYSVVERHPQLQAEIQQFLSPNGLDLLMDIASKRLRIVQKKQNALISYPLHLVPDTFQRYVFHLAAIMSNRDAVLLFEEPESHSYAPYVYQLAQHILDDEGGNQFFITTHNPYLLTPILQESSDVALFVTWFEGYQTHARRLSNEEIAHILNYGFDVFLNLDHFILNETF